MSTTANPISNAEARMQVLTKLSVTRRNAIKKVSDSETSFNINDQAHARRFRDEWSRQMENWLLRKFYEAPNIKTILSSASAYINAWQEDGAERGAPKQARDEFLGTVDGHALVLQPRRPQSSHNREVPSRKRLREENFEHDNGEVEEEDAALEHTTKQQITPAALRAHMLVTLLHLRNIQTGSSK
ncbi:hypothetical protein BGX26_011388 [Mortierella sp. AD094]|nr:hypothetical protein BGX26_011388 [Mortierella sp. AD094]